MLATTEPPEVLAIFVEVRLPLEIHPLTEPEEFFTFDFLLLLSSTIRRSPYFTVPVDFEKKPVPAFNEVDFTHT